MFVFPVSVCALCAVQAVFTIAVVLSYFALLGPMIQAMDARLKVRITLLVPVVNHV